MVYCVLKTVRLRVAKSCELARPHYPARVARQRSVDSGELWIWWHGWLAASVPFTALRAPSPRQHLGAKVLRAPFLSCDSNTRRSVEI